MAGLQMATFPPRVDIAALREAADCGDLQAVRDHLRPIAINGGIGPPCDLTLLEALHRDAKDIPILDAVVRCFLDNAPDLPQFVKECDERGRNLLHFLCWCGLDGIVAVLEEKKVEVGVDVNAPAQGERLITPLHLAAYHGHLGVVDVLGKWPGLDLVAASATGATALHLAATSGKAEMVEKILTLCRGQHASLPAAECSKKVSELVNARDCLGFTPLHYAAHKGHPEVVATLLRLAGGEVDLNCMANERLLRPMHLAALSSHCGCDEVVRLLLLKPKRGEDHSRGADPNAKVGGAVVDIGRSDLVSTLARDLSLVRRNLWIEDSPHPELFEVVCRDNCNLVSWTEGGVRVSFGRGGATALHLAAIRNCHPVAQALLESTSTDVNAIDVYGMTPLHYAVATGHADMVNLLVKDPRVEVNVVTNFEGRYWEETPLHLAVLMERPEVVQVLCSRPNLHGNAVNWDEKTALEVSWDRGSAMKQILFQRDEVKRYVEGLGRQQQSLHQAASALLVGATLVASLAVNFSNFNVPDKSAEAVQRDSLAFSIIPTLTMGTSDVLQCSVVFSFLAMVCGIAAVLPLLIQQDDPFIGQVVLRLQRGIAASSCSLSVAIFLALFHILYIKSEVGKYLYLDPSGVLEEEAAPPPAGSEGKLGIGTIWVGWTTLALIYAIFWIPLFGFPLLFLLKSLGRDPFRLRNLLSVFLPSPRVPKAIKLLTGFLDGTLWFFLVVVYLYQGVAIIYNSVGTVGSIFSIIPVEVGIMGCIAFAYAERLKRRGTTVLALVAFCAGVLLISPLFLWVPLAAILAILSKPCCARLSRRRNRTRSGAY